MSTVAFSAPVLPRATSPSTGWLHCCKQLQSGRSQRLQRPVVRAQLPGVDGVSVNLDPDQDGPTKPLWARVPAPVYSACTASSEVGRGNLNVLTYCTPLGLGATPKWAVALYVGTLTWTNVKQLGVVRLAPMTEKHAGLVGLFGKTSGRVIDKVSEASLMGFDVDCTENGVPFLVDGPGYIDLVVEQWVDCGDHELAICATDSVVEMESAGELPDSPILTTGTLREMGVLDKL